MSATSAPGGGGRIVTFYSYKGGIGRTMAVANVGWILASAGLRVLLIDWDLEAPGLHRYLSPFLDDPELAATPGIIDFLCDFATETRIKHTTDDWYQSSVSLLRYTQGVDWKFPGNGTLEFVGAGRQNAAYGIQVMGFDWDDFHEHLGGGLFLQAVKHRLRGEYDFVLIDSRTGISDSSGVCTVQMPDTLIVLFALNRQSIEGAAAVAASADRQRRKTKDEPALRIWPIPARIELAEKERLEAGRVVARATFDRFIGHLERDKRRAYWDKMEVIYQPYYAYEEALAVFADQHRSTNSMLASMEALASAIVGKEIESGMKDEERRRGLALYKSGGRTLQDLPAAHVYISYPQDHSAAAEAVRNALVKAGINTWWDRDILPGDDQSAIRKTALRAAALVAVLHGQRPLRSPQSSEIEEALALKKRLVPIVIGDDSATLPEHLSDLAAITVRPKLPAADLVAMTEGLLRVLERDHMIVPRDPADPQRGRFGGMARRNGRELTASVIEVSPDWFEIKLTVRTVLAPLLNGVVEFHLHPAHTPQVHQVFARRGVAHLTIYGYGAFTAGVIADNGQTQLELDLSTDNRFPPVFRNR
jgi:hypothetical protein